MLKHARRTLGAGLLGSLLVWSAAAEAIVVNLTNRATPRISIHVDTGGVGGGDGGGGGAIREVEFDVPAARFGDGTPVAGSTAIRIVLVVRASGAPALTATLSADSLSNPLTNTNGSGNTIPFSDISWTSQDGDIPAGAFNDTANQVIVSYQSSARIRDWHTFSYANTGDAEAGEYEGRVIYTWSIP